MIRILSLLLFSLIWTSDLIGQITTRSLDFENLGKQIELHDEKDIYGSLISKTLIIKNSNDDVIKTLDPLNPYENVYSFNAYHKGDRNFAIIGGRYIFYIINVSTNKLIGPFHPSWRVEAEDAQSFMLQAYKVIQEGQYLLVNSLGNGLTCYSLLDLYNPKEVNFFKSDSEIAPRDYYIFIDLRQENICN